LNFKTLIKMNSIISFIVAVGFVVELWIFYYKPFTSGFYILHPYCWNALNRGENGSTQETALTGACEIQSRYMHYDYPSLPEMLQLPLEQHIQYVDAVCSRGYCLGESSDNEILELQDKMQKKKEEWNNMISHRYEEINVASLGNLAWIIKHNKNESVVAAARWLRDDFIVWFTMSKPAPSPWGKGREPKGLESAGLRVLKS
jgi:hypothetical protein